MRPRWNNIALTVGGAVLLVLGSLILNAIFFDELCDLVFPAGADRSRIQLLCSVGVLISGTLAAIVILKNKEGG